MKSLYIISAFSLILFACNSGNQESISEKNTKTQLELTAEQVKNAGITTVSFEKKVIPQELKFFGVIDVPPQNMISVSLPLGGYLQSTQLLPGMHVNKGEVIATVEDPQFIQLQQEFLSAKSRLSVAEKEYQRQKELNASKAGSDKSLQLAESDYTTLKISLQAVGEKLRLIHLNPDALTEKNLSRSVKVYSPISGFVKKVNVNIGKYVMPSEVLFELVNPEDIHLNIKVFEKDLNKLRIGQKVLAFTNGEPTVKYPCEIILISKDLKADRSAEVHCHFEKYDHSLLPGMYMNAEVTLNSSGADVIPSSCILQYDGKSWVYISIGNNEYKATEVTCGITHDGFTEILNANQFPANVKIVNQGSYSLLMQDKKSTEE